MKNLRNSLKQDFIVGLDVEWKNREKGGGSGKSTTRLILSYQFAAVVNGTLKTHIIYLNRGKYRKSLVFCLSEFFSKPKMFSTRYGFFGDYRLLKTRFLPLIMACRVFQKHAHPPTVEILLGKYLAELVFHDIFSLTQFTSKFTSHDFGSEFHVTFKAHARNFLREVVKNSNYRIPKIYLGAHFNLGDFTAFTDFQKILRGSDTIGKGQSSVLKGYRVRLFAGDRHYFRDVIIVFRDTLALSKSSLAKLGTGIGLPKKPLEQHEIENMDVLLEQNPTKFEEYAVHDAVIVQRFMSNIHEEYGFIPATVSSLASATASQTLNALGSTPEGNWRGLKRSISTENKRKSVLIPATPQAGILITLGELAFHGGRNESHAHGVFEGTWNEYDLKSAYGTAFKGLKLIDWASIRPWTVGDIGSPGFSFITLSAFQFPKGCEIPCIPVLDEKGKGLIYPLSGYVCGPKNGKKHEYVITGLEYHLALDLGCKMEVNYGKSYFAKGHHGGVLNSMVKKWALDRAHAKQTYGEGSSEEIVAKLKINSMFGKMAQGLREDKKVYNSRFMKTKTLPPSAITSAPMAAYITSMVRTVVSAQAAMLTKRGFKVMSITTDSIVTNAELKDFSGEEKYSWALELLGKPEEMWDLKSQNKGHVELKTRGSFGLENGEIMKARARQAGYQLPASINKSDQLEVCKHMWDLYKKYTVHGNRVPNHQLRFPSTREVQLEKLEAGTKYPHLVMLSWNYDHKRQALSSIDFFTRPWSNMDDFVRNREWIDKYGHRDVFERRSSVELALARGARIHIRKNMNLEVRKVASRLARRGMINYEGYSSDNSAGANLRALSKILGCKTPRTDLTSKACQILLSEFVLQRFEFHQIKLNFKALANEVLTLPLVKN